MTDKSTKLTNEQNDICYEIKFAFMRADHFRSKGVLFVDRQVEFDK